MKIILDTANLEDIRYFNTYYPIVGVTTNPTILAREGGVYALDFAGERYDLGSKVGFLKANVVKGLTHPETAEEFREFIKEIAKTL